MFTRQYLRQRITRQWRPQPRLALIQPSSQLHVSKYRKPHHCVIIKHVRWHIIKEIDPDYKLRIYLYEKRMSVL